MEERIGNAIDQIVRRLLQEQNEIGCWDYCFESGTMTDALMLLLMKWLGYKKPEIEELLIQRILSKQTQEGTWKLFQDEKEGNLNETIYCCLALLYTDNIQPKDIRMQRAKDFIHSKGGVVQGGSFSKIVLSILGHLDWGKSPSMPIEILLLSGNSPVNFCDFVGYTRVHLAPVLVLANQRFSVKLPGHDKVSEWIQACGSTNWIHNHRSWWTRFFKMATWLRSSSVRRRLQDRSYLLAEQFMLNRIEPDGTLYCYFTSTFLMIFALVSLGYPKNHPLICQAMEGLIDLIFPLQEEGHLQETSSTIWDTSLILYALQEAGVSSRHPAIRRGTYYLLNNQQHTWGDWRWRNPGICPGGWGFSRYNTINPDIDDTGACLRVIAPAVMKGKYEESWNRGVNWLLSMQNRDGGWSAFEKNTNKMWLYLLPYDDTESILGDPSTADLTGRALEFLGNYLGWSSYHFAVRQGVDWLARHQQFDGSWYGRWGISYIYGTWAALTGLAAVQFPRGHPMVEKAVEWLKSIQNQDGGWGESCQSQIEHRYIPLQASTPSQTAWALDALIAYHDKPTPEIKKGVQCLLELLEKDSWEISYPTGAGLAGQFYIYYHSYNHIWPLVTLSHYWNRYI
ncbi:prenyltransferase/squalene oxidase repeat-containing protein [Thermoflavimicrobium daqui]|jgi:sporulenol synthase|uniref:Squalene--hopene cyclase n=1 Tax=Thermoflavimicrobium daqui TaxID=2137476 RepID=A0A364K9B4_9BACL|nr:prenyltransferase/squalene oxidase repeat-containing protein [Thermoflavimicrobium daqui]RAL26885.1 squalene--hopene cyclase [Thermoflavimicrobium daqui]